MTSAELVKMLVNTPHSKMATILVFFFIPGKIGLFGLAFKRKIQKGQFAIKQKNNKMAAILK